ncbi:MAG: hypothetical protein ABJC09_05560 [Terriglobia bacterium]
MIRRLLLTFMAAGLARGVIVDGIAVTVGTQVITTSEIESRIRLTAFENASAPSFDRTARKVTAEQLIDQKLVEREMDVGRYPRSAVAAREGLISAYAKSYFASDPRALTRALLLRGLTVADLEQDLARQTDLLTFLSLRFRPDARAGDSEMEAWLREQRKRIRIEYLDKDLAP